MSSISSKIHLFDRKDPTTTNHSPPTKSVSFGASKQTQQQQNFAFNNDSRLRNNYLQQQKPSSTHQNSTSIDKANKSSSLSGGSVKQIEDNCVSHRGNKMVAKQEIVNETQVQQTAECDEEGEDSFKYGPGFVSKLRYRYLSLTLRQTSVEKTKRPSLAQLLRRSTSLNNLLDEETDEHEQDVVHEEEDENRDEKVRETSAVNGNNKVAQENQKNHIRNHGIEKPLTDSFPPPSDGHHIRTGRSQDKSLNLKRARSVEAILRYDHSAWERDVQKDHIEHASVKKPCDVTIEDKIHNARDRPLLQPPKRLTSLIDDVERPPPGICKQTMLIFEASANRKRSSATRPIGQEVANKVAMFKCQEKPAVASKKPNVHPRITSPKPITHLNNNTTNNNASKTMNNSEKFAKFTKEKTVLPKLDINIIKNNLETKTNGSWSPADNKDSYRNLKLDYSPAHSDSSLSSTPNVLSPFRNSMSPQLNDPLPAQKLDPIASSPLISSLSSKLNNLHMGTSTPKAYNKSNNLLKIADDLDVVVVSVDKDDSPSDNAKHNNNGDVLKSPNDELKTTVMSFIPKINNNVGTNGKVNHEKLPADNNSEVKMVKENSVITKPSQAPPPPPYTMKPQLPPSSRDNNDKSSFVPPANDSKNSAESTATDSSAAAPKWTVKKKSWSSQGADDASSNTIVFNFSDRKDVPDYIEHDGLILRRKRELPKPNESGFVLLGDLTLDSSTDPDDGYQMGPPSPCDVEFENANIVPDGKSSIRSRPKEVKFKIQFDDSLTATFEYPSETSLMIDEWLGDEDEVDASFYGRSSNGNNNSSSSSSSSKLLNSVPLGSTPFANYQPQKASGTTFELGITRTTPSPSSGSSDENTFISNPESDGDDYLKPATDEESQRWSSEGTRATDLLF